MLGHKSVSQTSTYLNVTRIGLQESMRKFDELGGRCKIVASKQEIGRTPSCNSTADVAPQPLVN